MARTVPDAVWIERLEPGEGRERVIGRQPITRAAGSGTAIRIERIYSKSHRAAMNGENPMRADLTDASNPRTAGGTQAVAETRRTFVERRAGIMEHIETCRMPSAHPNRVRAGGRVLPELI
jgi:hypothetical protein